MRTRETRQITTAASLPAISMGVVMHGFGESGGSVVQAFCLVQASIDRIVCDKERGWAPDDDGPPFSCLLLLLSRSPRAHAWGADPLPVRIQLGTVSVRVRARSRVDWRAAWYESRIDSVRVAHRANASIRPTRVLRRILIQTKPRPMPTFKTKRTPRHDARTALRP